ncbi:hypothetical protein ACI2UC_23790 [Ralstonia nicotianae]
MLAHVLMGSLPAQSTGRNLPSGVDDTATHPGELNMADDSGMQRDPVSHLVLRRLQALRHEPRVSDRLSGRSCVRSALFGRVIMDTIPTGTYRGYDLYPLFYRSPLAGMEGHAKTDHAYGVSVLICREGTEPGGEQCRVFRLNAEPMDCVGKARLAAIAFAQRIIDGDEVGQSVEQL